MIIESDHLIRFSLAIFPITNALLNHTATAAGEKPMFKSQGSRAQLMQISTTVTSNFIIFNKTSTSKPQLILNKSQTGL